MPTRAQAHAWIAVLGLVMPCVAAGQDRTERDLVDLVVRDGPQARAIRADTDVTRREQEARLAYPNPGVLYSREGAGFTEFLQVEQTLPLFGIRGALSRAGVAASAAADADRDARLWQLRAEATAAVAQLSAEQSRLTAAEAHAQEIARLIGVLRTREQEGEGSRFDRLRAEQELRDARYVATSAAVGVADARAGLSAMLPADVEVTRVPDALGEVRPIIALDTLTTRATSSRAELRALQLSAERATLEAEAARKARWPAPTVFGGLKRADTEKGRENGGVFGVSLAVPLFDTGDREAARWNAERARAEAERVAIAHQIRREIARASDALALRQDALAQDEASAADDLTRIAEVAYREGEVGILELLDAVRTASRARLRTIDLMLDARLAQIALERAVGDILWP
jgi:cobalt-zinc-cadmium efflux system outer membrane protein